MFQSIPRFESLFLDIETTPCADELEQAPERLKDLWIDRCKRQSKDGDCDPTKQWKDQAALIPEFSQVVCIVLSKWGLPSLQPKQPTVQNAIGIHGQDLGAVAFAPVAPVPVLTARRFVLLPTTEFPADGPIKEVNGRTSTLYFNTEKELLHAFRECLDKATAKPQSRLVPEPKVLAHNGRNFDYPYLTRRYLIHGLLPARCLQTIDSKPWETQLVDTKELWSFGSRSYEHRITLDELCGCLGIPSPKDNMHGSEVAHYFFRVQDGYRLIADYCEKDVSSLADVVAKLHELA